MKVLRGIMVVLALMLLAAGPSVAQQAMQQGGAMVGAQGDDAEFDAGPARGKAQFEERREEVRKKIEAVRIYRLTEELKLDTPTSGKLAALLGSLDQQRVKAMREHRAAMAELQMTLKSGAVDEKKLKPLLERIEKSQRDQASLREQEVKGVRDILTVEQQARFILFNRDFMREMRGMIAGARGGQGQGGRGGMGQGGRGGMGGAPAPDQGDDAGGPPSDR